MGFLTLRRVTAHEEQVHRLGQPSSPGQGVNHRPRPADRVSAREHAVDVRHAGERIDPNRLPCRPTEAQGFPVEQTCPPSKPTSSSTA